MSASMGAGLGAAAGGLGVFMLCNSKCPGGVKGAGILGALGGIDIIRYIRLYIYELARFEIDHTIYKVTYHI